MCDGAVLKARDGGVNVMSGRRRTSLLLIQSLDQRLRQDQGLSGYMISL